MILAEIVNKKTSSRKSRNNVSQHQDKLKKIRILSVAPVPVKEHKLVRKKSSKLFQRKPSSSHLLQRKSSSRMRLRGGGILQQSCFPMTCTPMICLPSSPQMICNPCEPTVLVCTPCPKEATESTPCTSGATSAQATPYSQVASPSQYQQPANTPCVQVEPPTPIQPQIPSAPSTYARLPVQQQYGPPVPTPVDFGATATGFLQPYGPSPSPMNFYGPTPTAMQISQNVQGANLDRRFQSLNVERKQPQIQNISLPPIKIQEIFTSLKKTKKESDDTSFTIQISYVDSEESGRICPGDRPKPRPETRRDLFGAKAAMLPASPTSGNQNLTLTDFLNDSFVDRKILEAVEKYSVKELTEEELNALPYATQAIYRLAKVYIDERYMLIQMLLQAKQIKAKITNPKFKEGQNPVYIQMYLKLKKDSLELAIDLKKVYEMFLVLVSRWLQENPGELENVVNALGHLPPPPNSFSFSQSSCLSPASPNALVQQDMINVSPFPCIPGAPPNSLVQQSQVSDMIKFSQSPCLPAAPPNSPMQQGQASNLTNFSQPIAAETVGQQQLGTSFGQYAPSQSFNLPESVPPQISFFQPAGQEKIPMSLNDSSIGKPKLQSTGIADLGNSKFQSMEIQLSISETDAEGNVTNIEHDFNLPKEVKPPEPKAAAGISEEVQQKEKDTMMKLLKEFQDNRRQAVMSSLTSQDLVPQSDGPSNRSRSFQ